MILFNIVATTTSEIYSNDPRDLPITNFVEKFDVFFYLPANEAKCSPIFSAVSTLTIRCK